MSEKQFYLKTVFVVVAAIVIIFFAKIWIVDPFTFMKSNAVMNTSQLQTNDTDLRGTKKNFSKEKIKINWRDASKHIDEYVITEGEIVSGYNNGKVCYLNFDKNYKDYLALVIFSTKFSRFPEKPEKYYLGKNVRVEGRIKDYKGRQEIILGSQESIVIIDKIK